MLFSYTFLSENNKKKLDFFHIYFLSDLRTENTFFLKKKNIEYTMVIAYKCEKIVSFKHSTNFENVQRIYRISPN